MKPVAILLASAAALPRREDLGVLIEDVLRAEARGYFLPDEDERLRTEYSRYLAVRAALHSLLSDLSRGQWQHSQTEDLRGFTQAYAAACLLVRAATYLIEITADSPVTRKKLDEPELRYHIEGNSFTRIYKSLTSPKQWMAFFDATDFYQANRDKIHALRQDESMVEVLRLVQEEELKIELQRDELIKKRLSYRIHSFFRRNRSGYRKVMFSLFRLSGCSIAELKQPFVKPIGAPKRVDADVRARLETFLEPGDLLVTRHDDALSNLFLPGFWPHAAFYLGRNQCRAKLGLDDFGMDDDVRFIESKRDGVRLRPASDTLQVDTLVVLRPLIAKAQVAEAIERALTHTGKLYDFVFDFTASDRLACTELVYRSFHGVGDVQLQLQSHAGRLCLSAECLMDQLLCAGWFEPVLIYGLNGSGWTEGKATRQMLRASYGARFD